MHVEVLALNCRADILNNIEKEYDELKINVYFFLDMKKILVRKWKIVYIFCNIKKIHVIFEVEINIYQNSL